MANGLFIVSAPSGSGKSTLVRSLLERLPSIRFSISYTTRAPRGRESHGREYFFVSEEQFRAMVDSGDFLEHAEVFGHGYGTAWSFLREAFTGGDDLILDIDVQGARQVRRRFAEHAGSLAQAGFATSIFIAPPDRATLERRLNQRGLDQPAVIETRLRDAVAEIAAYNDYDYVLINDRLEESVNRLEAIVQWERQRHGRAVPPPPGGRGSWQAMAEACLRTHAAPALEPVLSSFGVASAPLAAKLR